MRTMLEKEKRGNFSQKKNSYNREKTMKSHSNTSKKKEKKKENHHKTSKLLLFVIS